MQYEARSGAALDFSTFGKSTEQTMAQFTFRPRRLSKPRTLVGASLCAGERRYDLEPINEEATRCAVEEAK